MSRMICAIVLAMGMVNASGAELPLTVPVRVLNNAPPVAGTRMANVRIPQATEPAQPTTPAGKLPQYRINSHRSENLSDDDLKGPKLRFLLALPARLVLLEVAVTIDGESFRAAREKRVAKIIADLKANPEAEDSTVPDRIRRYVKATGETPSAEEIRWLLETWDGGPTVLMLKDNFQRFRAGERPVFHVLDRNRDEVISAEELNQAVKSFQECDLNRNDIVEYTEIAASVKDPRRQPKQIAGAGRLLFRVPDESTARQTYTQIAAHYSSAATPILPRFDANKNARFDPEELKSLKDSPADLQLRIAFNTNNPEKSQMQLTAVSEELKGGIEKAKRQQLSLVVPIGNTQVAFSAVQKEGDDRISFGAVEDGYPILPALDPNDDGRFTIRELRELVARLKKFDRNADGKLTADETQSTIRVAIGLGPWVHRELATIRSINPKPKTAPYPGPEWFVRMDRNKDTDLTRGEFPGTNEQFANLDADKDGLISSAEALAFDKKSKK